jgi:Lrp/AsnC family leucine-responsive transcriptional regulator
MYDALDDFDHKILRELQADGRAPVAQIAERVGLSRPAVSDRIEKLEVAGVICGTTAIIHPAALRRDITAFISARRAQSGQGDQKFEKGFRALLAREDIREVHTVAGDDCYLIKVQTDSIGSLNDIVRLMNGGPLQLSTRTTIVMATHCEKLGGVVLPREVSNEA